MILFAVTLTAVLAERRMPEKGELFLTLLVRANFTRQKQIKVNRHIKRTREPVARRNSNKTNVGRHGFASFSSEEVVEGKKKKRFLVLSFRLSDPSRRARSKEGLLLRKATPKEKFESHQVDGSTATACDARRSQMKSSLG